MFNVYYIFISHTRWTPCLWGSQVIMFERVNISIYSERVNLALHRTRKWPKIQPWSPVHACLILICNITILVKKGRISLIIDAEKWSHQNDNICNASKRLAIPTTTSHSAKLAVPDGIPSVGMRLCAHCMRILCAKFTSWESYQPPMCLARVEVYLDQDNTYLNTI